MLALVSLIELLPSGPGNFVTEFGSPGTKENEISRIGILQSQQSQHLSNQKSNQIISSLDSFF
jgi:hypothetical protein